MIPHQSLCHHQHSSNTKPFMSVVKKNFDPSINTTHSSSPDLYSINITSGKSKNQWNNNHNKSKMLQEEGIRIAQIILIILQEIQLYINNNLWHPWNWMTKL